MTKPSTITPHTESPHGEERFVAAGGTCACYLLRRHGRLLLKKQLLPAFAHDERHRQALEKEFEVGFQLDHPNIPRYLEYHGDSLLMDFVDGVTLTEFLRQHPDYFRKRQHARQFADELLSAVDYLHQQQILHLDLKPDNIMITRIGNHVKLIDLGFCHQDSHPFTTGGTAYYAAPDKEKTPASDIYSLGRIFSELGIGRKAVVAKCLSANAADRYQSVDELARAMSKQRDPRMAMAALLLLLLLGGVTWWWMEKKDTMNSEPFSSVMQQHTSDSSMKSGTSPIDGSIPLPEEADVDGTDKQDAHWEIAPSHTSGIITDVSSTTALDTIPKDYIPKKGLRAMQAQSLDKFKPATDSILTEFRQFVYDKRMPYKIGSLDAYKAAYDSLKNAILSYGQGSKNHFWMRIYWQKYNGKPKPYDPCDNYLYEQLADIEARYQANISSYKHDQMQ